MQALLVVINVLLILNAIILIVAVLMQEGNRAGLGAIGGGAETFFGKSKAKSYEGKLEMITKIGAATFIVLAIVMTAMSARISNTAAVAPSVQTEAAEGEIEVAEGETEAAEGETETAEGEAEAETADAEAGADTAEEAGEETQAE